MEDEKLANRVGAQKVKGKRRRGRLRMWWEDYIKRDLERVGGEWRTTAKDKELETVDGECSERKVRRGKKRQRKDDSNHGQPHP